VDVPINSIAQLFEEENPEKVINILLEQQKKECMDEISERQKKVETLEQIERSLKVMESFSVESIGDIVHIMKNVKKLRRIRMTMLFVGLVVELIEWATLFLGIVKGNWIPFLVGLPIMIGIGVAITKFYFDKIVYICPECHTVFKPKFKEVFWANHTPTTRKLTCTKCGHKGFCVETCEEETK
jgi:DNA-directed RNA polymerase subunit RPC12/RpoP